MIFIGISCEDGKKNHDSHCYSHGSNGSGMFGHDSVQGVLAARCEVELHAKSIGWKKTENHGWICPHCARERAKLDK